MQFHHTHGHTLALAQPQEHQLLVQLGKSEIIQGNFHCRCKHLGCSCQSTQNSFQKSCQVFNQHNQVLFSVKQWQSMESSWLSFFKERSTSTSHPNQPIPILLCFADILFSGLEYLLAFRTYFVGKECFKFKNLCWCFRKWMCNCRCSES